MNQEIKVYWFRNEISEYYFVGTDGLHWRERCVKYEGYQPEWLAEEPTLNTEILWIGLELRGAVRIS